MSMYKNYSNGCNMFKVFIKIHKVKYMLDEGKSNSVKTYTFAIFIQTHKVK